jgi:uncharacterized protein YndB with AHSA1/START domain
MARNSVTIKARPAEVFAVLTDAHAYGFWVVGAKKVRGKDRSWPRRGSRFHHTVGVGPATLEDNSEVLDIRTDRRLKLEVRVRPFGTATVDVHLRPTKRGKATKVVMFEEPRRGVASKVWNPAFDAAMHVRNDIALRRLKKLAEARAGGA